MLMLESVVVIFDDRRDQKAVSTCHLMLYNTQASHFQRESTDTGHKLTKV